MTISSEGNKEKNSEDSGESKDSSNGDSQESKKTHSLLMFAS